MTIRHLAVLLVVAFALAGCGSGISVRSDFDPQTDFSGLKTYQWKAARSEGNALLKAPMAGKRVTAAVDQVLASKGYRLATDAPPDFYVVTHAGAKDKVNVTQWGYGYGGYWGPYGYGPGGSSVSVNYYTETTLFIDLVQKKADNFELIWRGMGTGVVQQLEPEEAQQRANDAVALILENFPPKKK